MNKREPNCENAQHLRHRLITYTTQDNDPRKAGQLAGAKIALGEHGRYRLAPVHTRFADVTWMVWDAETLDEVTGLAGVIRQGENINEAVSGLLSA